MVASAIDDGRSPWDYCCVLIHYYTNITFVNLSNTRNDNRFNALAMVNLLDGYTFHASHDVQNTGTTPWSLGKDGTASCVEGIVYESDNTTFIVLDHKASMNHCLNKR